MKLYEAKNIIKDTLNLILYNTASKTKQGIKIC